MRPRCRADVGRVQPSTHSLPLSNRGLKPPPGGFSPEPSGRTVQPARSGGSRDALVQSRSEAQVHSPTHPERQEPRRFSPEQ